MDIGEGFPFDEALLSFATSANICCGEHAGSWDLTMQTIDLCLKAGVRIGMHPGYPDRANMGRKPMGASEIKRFGNSFLEQVERFYFFVPAAYLKPHGALYNDAASKSGRGEFARVFVREACRRYRLPLMALPHTLLADVAQASSVELIREGFADRRYLPNGTLMPRTSPEAVLHDPAEIRSQVLRLADEVDSICLHGDTPGCVGFAEMVCSTLLEAGYEVEA